MGLDSAGYIFSDLLNFIFRINVIANIKEYKFVYTRREGGFVCSAVILSRHVGVGFEIVYIPTNSNVLVIYHFRLL